MRRLEFQRDVLDVLYLAAVAVAGLALGVLILDAPTRHPALGLVGAVAALVAGMLDRHADGPPGSDATPTRAHSLPPNRRRA